MVLVVCEKPSMARSLAAVLGAKQSKDGYMAPATPTCPDEAISLAEGGGYLVSWCYGHLVELAPPAAYDDAYKRWNRADLPILPKAWKHTASPDKQKQLDILRSLMSRADVHMVVNACDAGREGELIFQLVYEYCQCKKPVKRLWISSMEDAAIRAGFDNLCDGNDYDTLYHAALCRAQADWLVGMNATRLFSCLYGATLSVGRVQSPTLAMLVKREAAAQAFVPEAFFTPAISLDGFTARGDRLATLMEAEAVHAACNGRDAAVLSIEKTKKSEAPPKLYDLTTLQRDANRLLGYTAQQTLDYTQALYEKKLATYPRTDSRYLTEDMAEGVPQLVHIATRCLPFISISAPVNTALVVDGTKVTDHHALLPTQAVRGLDLETLPSGERNILTMLIVRLACAVGEAHSFEAVAVLLACGVYQFAAKGKTVLRDGWKAIDTAFRQWIVESGKPPAEDMESETDLSLPNLLEGQVFSSVAATIKEGKTSPPRRFTEDLLLAAMEAAGAEGTGNCSNDAERKGLGTPATRAGVIEKLIKCGVVERKKKLLVPTEKGRALITVLPEELTSPLLTAEWEHRLGEVERGQLSGAAFMDGIAGLVSGLVAAYTAPVPTFAALFAQPPKGAVVGKCPRCGEAVTEAAKGFFCLSRACRFALWEDSRFWSAKGKKLDKKTAAALLKDGRVFFTDLKSEKTGKTYAAAVLLEDDGQKVNYKLDFESGRKAA